MRRIVLIACLSLLAASLLPVWMYCQEKLSIHARIWKYESICDFKDPDHSSGYSLKPTTDKVTLEVTNCTTFQQKNGQPAAVCITFKNQDKAPIDVAIDKELSSVTLTDKENQEIKAVAKRALVEGPMGGKKMEFVTKADASYLLKLEAGEEVNVVYLFPKAGVGDTVRIGKLKPVKIEASGAQ
jgi:hypothetical protein